MDKKNLTFAERILRLQNMASSLAFFAGDLEEEANHMTAAAARFEKRQVAKPSTTKAA